MIPAPPFSVQENLALAAEKFIDTLREAEGQHKAAERLRKTLVNTLLTGSASLRMM
jgi:hypothetical protein